MSFLWFWTIFDLKFGPLAKKYVGCSAPDLKRRLGVKFPAEGTFFPQTPGLSVTTPSDLRGPVQVKPIPVFAQKHARPRG